MPHCGRVEPLAEPQWRPRRFVISVGMPRIITSYFATHENLPGVGLNRAADQEVWAAAVSTDKRIR
jgi:hypothetical protein